MHTLLSFLILSAAPQFLEAPARAPVEVVARTPPSARRRFLIAGAATFASAYTAIVLAGLANESREGSTLYIPLTGPFIVASDLLSQPRSKGWFAEFREDARNFEVATLLFNGASQLLGLVFALVGLTFPNVPVMISPGISGASGAQVGAQVLVHLP